MMRTLFKAEGKRQKAKVWLALILLPSAFSLLPSALSAQTVPFVPLRPQTKQEIAHREALKLYALALMCQHQDRLLEATRTLEEARELDPDATPLYKTLIPLYLALSRTDEALAACRKALDLDPGDYETWAVYARQLKLQGNLKEARTALERALASAAIKEHPDQIAQINYDLGAVCEDLQEHDGAVSAFHEVVKVLNKPHLLLDAGSFSRAEIQEQAANTYERMIRICVRAKRYNRALELFEEARPKYPALSRRINYYLAQAYTDQGQHDKALSHLDEYLKTQPQEMAAYELRGSILQQLGRAEEILPALEEFARRDANNIPLHLLLAQQYGRANRTREAEALYKKLAEETPTPEIYRGLFALYQQEPRLGMGRALLILDAAIRKGSLKEDGTGGDAQAAAQARAMLAALNAEPAFAGPLLQAGQSMIRNERAGLHFETAHLLAVLAARTHQLVEAEQFYRRCLDDLREGPRSNPEKEVTVYGGLIQVLRDAGKYDAVVEICRRGLRQTRGTNRLLFHLHLSEALMFLGKPEEALTEANLAVDRADDANRLGAKLHRIEVLSRAERHPQALAEGEALLKEFSQPGSIRRIRYVLSGVYSSMRDFAKAGEQLQLILKTDPNDSTANNDLGYLWADQGQNLEEAEKLIRKALELDRQERKTGTALTGYDEQENYAYLDSLGWVLFRRGQLETARGYLEKAASQARGDTDPVIWDHLGDVYFRLEEKARAREAWRKALTLYETDKRRKLDDHYKEVQHKLQLLNTEMQPQ
jgi:pentatricopeptide repeat protein